MRKSRFMVLALVVAVMLMGAGYAAWTDQIRINNTVSTGHMDIKWVTQDKTNPDGAYPRASVSVFGPSGSIPGAPRYATITPSPYSDKDVYVNVTDLFPGALVKADFKLVNHSTMAVVLKDFEVAFDEANTTSGIKDALMCSVSWILKDKDGVEKARNNGNGAVNKLSAFEARLDAAATGIVMEPGDVLYFDQEDSEENCIGFMLPLSETGFQNAKAQFTIKANFEQYNASDANIQLWKTSHGIQ